MRTFQTFLEEQDGSEEFALAHASRLALRTHPQEMLQFLQQLAANDTEIARELQNAHARHSQKKLNRGLNPEKDPQVDVIVPNTPDSPGSEIEPA